MSAAGVHVGWLVVDAGEVPLDDAWLTAGERATLAGLRVPKRRADWRLGRWALKRGVLRAMRVVATRDAAADLEVRPASSGAPTVWRRGGPLPCSVSLSHAAGRALVVVAAPGVALGCDMEHVEPRVPALLHTFFTDAEQAAVAVAPAEVRDRLVTLFWCAKESAAKALTEGLRLDARDLAVSLAPGAAGASADGWRLFAVDTPDGPFAGWWRVADDVVLAVAARPAPMAPVRLDADVARGDGVAPLA